VGIGIPPRRMDQCRVDPAFVHLLQHVGRREVGDLAVIHIRRLVVLPDVDLCVDDQHEALLPFWLVAGAAMELPVLTRESALLVARSRAQPPRWGMTFWAMSAISP